MKTLELNLSETIVAKLEEAAERLSLTAEQLAILSLEEKLEQLDGQPNLDPQFKDAAKYVLDKNAELHKRLA
jgi:ABC-type phosphate transport system auxiliary subunit